MSTYRLDKLFAPRSVALVGASPREGSLGRTVLTNLREAGFPGPILLVNPKHREIDGEPCVARIEDLPPAPDLIVITTPPAAVPRHRRERRPKGAARRRDRHRRARPRARLARRGGAARGARHGLRLVGPNCLGVMAPPAKLNASFAARAAAAGRSRADLAIGRHRGGPDRMGGAAPGRLLRPWSRSATGRRRFRRLPRLLRRRPRHPRDPALHRERSPTRASSCRRPAPPRAPSRSW